MYTPIGGPYCKRKVIMLDAVLFAIMALVAAGCFFMAGYSVGVMAQQSKQPKEK